MYGEIIKKDIYEAISKFMFSVAPFEEALGRTLFIMDHIWRKVNKSWADDTVTKELIDCLCVPREFCSWLRLAT